MAYPHLMGSIFYLRLECGRGFPTLMITFTSAKTASKLILSWFNAELLFQKHRFFVNVEVFSPKLFLKIAPSPSMLSCRRSRGLRAKSESSTLKWGGARNQHWNMKISGFKTSAACSVYQAEVKNRTHQAGIHQKNALKPDISFNI